MKKPFKIATTVQRLAEHLAKFVCDKSHAHALTQGADTVLTGNYTAQFCSEVMKALEEATRWMDVVETDFQRKLRACENHASCYSDL
eukprot:6456920-Amphidinium_carterae.1